MPKRREQRSGRKRAERPNGSHLSSGPECVGTCGPCHRGPAGGPPLPTAGGFGDRRINLGASATGCSRTCSPEEGVSVMIDRKPSPTAGGTADRRGRANIPPPLIACIREGPWRPVTERGPSHTQGEPSAPAGPFIPAGTPENSNRSRAAGQRATERRRARLTDSARGQTPFISPLRSETHRGPLACGLHSAKPRGAKKQGSAGFPASAADDRSQLSDDLGHKARAVDNATNATALVSPAGSEGYDDDEACLCHEEILRS
ncbi:hypothetical protein AAFF_G00158920 [Aldrovandia affinis]|uniref:Uncharacterized protein n=1 Tax=Aldrovandia affinis TaxID=143900 RepID=A0AAD7W8Z3_9TELE|nr:hypothetical protein AAFF_G00158920 [Aldrovandia affinis]